jgi:hypothetical protein
VRKQFAVACDAGINAFRRFVACDAGINAFRRFAWSF